MALKRTILDAACIVASPMTSAENARDELDMTLLQNIHQTVCAGGSEMVSGRVRLWLNVNGCNEPRITTVHACCEEGSGGFNF